MTTQPSNTGLGNKGNSRKERLAEQARQQLACEAIAEAAAREDLAFLGNDVWKGYSTEQRQKLETALIQFARTGASRAWSYLTKNL